MLWMSTIYHQQVIPHLGGSQSSLTPKVVLRSRPTWAPAESTFPGGPRWRRGYRLRDSHMFENSIRATTSDGDLRCESGSLRPGSCQKAVFRRLCITDPAAASRPPRRGRQWAYRPRILRLGWSSASAAARLQRPRSIGHSAMHSGGRRDFHLSASTTDFGALFTAWQR